MALIHTLRYPVFAVVLISSVIVLGLDGYSISFTSPYGGYYTYAALGVAVAVLSLVSIPLFLTLDILRPTLVTSAIWFELLWAGILWVLWLAAAADAASLGITSCSSVFLTSEEESLCRKFQAAEAFAFIAWIFLFAYWLWLLVVTIIDQTHGHEGIWHTSVRSATFQPSSYPEMSTVPHTTAAPSAPAPAGTAPVTGYPAHPAYDSPA